MRGDVFMRRCLTTPPAVVVGVMDTVGLGIVRDLGSVGVPVLAVGPDTTATALLSRYCVTARCHDPRYEEEAFLDDMRRIGAALPRRAVVFPAFDDYVWALSEHADRLEDLFLLPFARWDVMRRLADKEEQMREVDWNGVQVLDVVFLLEEELEEIRCLFRVLRVLEDHPGLGIDLAGSLLPGRPVGLEQHPEVLGIARALGCVLLDIAGAPAVALVNHGYLAGGQIGERVQVAVTQPSWGKDGVIKLLVEIEHLDHLFLGEGGPTGLEVEESASVGPGQLRNQDVNEEPHAREREAVAGHPAGRVPLHHGLGHLEEVIPGLRWLQSLLLEDVLPVDEEVRIRGVRDAVVFSVKPAKVPNRLEDVLLSDGVRDVLLIAEEALVIEGGAGKGLPVAGIRRGACCQGRCQLGLQVSPGQTLLPYRDVRVQFLIVIDDLLECRNRLRFGLRMPDPDHLLLGRKGNDGNGKNAQYRNE